MEDLKTTEKVGTDHGDASENDAADAPPSLSALSNNDPCVLTNIFEPSKIKNFVYKIEPNIAKFNASSLDLISTTAALIIKALVENAVMREQDDTRHHTNKKIRKDESLHESLHVEAQHLLLASNQLKRVVTANSPSSLDFLTESYRNFRDKDASFLPSRLNEYIPRKACDKTKRANKRSVATVAGNFEKGETERNEDSNKKLKSNHACRGSSSSSFSPKDCSDADPLKRAIRTAVNAEEKHVLDEIIEDEDDYD